MKTTTGPFQAVLRLLLKWWWLIAVAVALGAGVGYFIRSQQKDIFYARTSVLFGQNVSSGSGQVASLQQVRDLMTIYSGLVRREKILQPVIDKLGLGITVEALNQRMQVKDDSDLPVLDIIISDTDAVAAANIANAIAQEMIDQSPTQQVSQDTEFKRQQLRDLASQINQLKAQYNDLLSTGATLTSAFEIAQNLDQQQKALAAIQSLQKLYADMSAGMPDTGSLMQIFDYATAENALAVSGSMVSVILAGVGGLVVSLGTIVLIAYLDDRLEWQDGLEQVLETPVLGPLGIIPKNKLPLYLSTLPDSVESEVLRQLRAKLVLVSGGTSPKLTTVTSYDSGDGKTVTVSNLALASAQAGLRTLVVDGDMRKGNLHELFHLPNVMGLSDVLASHEDLLVMLSRALLDSGYENLTVLSAGRSNADPASLLARPRFDDLIDALRLQFDVIFFDSVPTIGGPDSTFLAEISDGVVIVVNSRHTTEKALRRTLQVLQQGRKTNIMGITFNRVPLQVTSRYSQPYYRRTLSISADKLNKEMLEAGTGRRLINFSRNIHVTKDGRRLLGLAASALQLGVSEDTLKEWIRTGYIKAERYGRRQWISESEINALLDRLPRHQMPVPVDVQSLQPAAEAASKIRNKGTTGRLPTLVGSQRDALVASAREASKPKKGDS